MVVFLLVALALLGLRQHRLELTSQTAQLQADVQLREQTMWGQRMKIAQETNPVVLAAELKKQGLADGGGGSVLPWDRQMSTIGLKNKPKAATGQTGDLLDGVVR